MTRLEWILLILLVAASVVIALSADVDRPYKRGLIYLFWPLMLIWELLKLAWEALPIKSMQLEFFWKFYFTKTYSTPDPETFKSAQIIAKHHSGIRGWSWRLALKLLDKRHHYTTNS